MELRRLDGLQADGKKHAVADLDIWRHVPCELVRNALPKALATKLLQVCHIMSMPMVHVLLLDSEMNLAYDNDIANITAPALSVKRIHWMRFGEL